MNVILSTQRQKVLIALTICLALSACPEKNGPLETATVIHPVDELNALDTRLPVPLQPMMAWHQKQNMMEHLVAIQRITSGVVEEDWAEINDAASLIAISPQMQKMCQHMGMGAPGFTETALDFHRRAGAILQASHVHDGKAVMRALSDTLQACTGCHATYRQDIVDEETWHKRADSSPPSMGHMRH